MRRNGLDLQTGDLKLYVCRPIVLKYQAEYNQSFQQFLNFQPRQPLKNKQFRLCVI